MNLNREKRKKRRAQTDEAIHIVALWNLMLILIPFLLLSAAFSQTSILNLMTPSANAAAAKKESDLSKEPIQLILGLNGFQLNQGPSRSSTIPLRSGHYDYSGLFAALERFKKETPAVETIILSSSSKVPYEIIVQAMDQCREAKFPNIVLGADSPEDKL